jgi:hypothetical protein
MWIFFRSAKKQPGNWDESDLAEVYFMGVPGRGSGKKGRQPFVLEVKRNFTGSMPGSTLRLRIAMAY